VTVSVVEREIVLIDAIEREGDCVRGNKRTGAVRGEAVITGSCNRWLRTRQARLRCLRAPKDCRGRSAIGDAARDIRDRKTGAHVTAGFNVAPNGGSKLFVPAEQALQSLCGVTTSSNQPLCEIP
jgi:hypothetical protein